MKLVIRGIAALAIVLVAAATLAYASGGGASAGAHIDLASGLVNLAGKFAIIAALIAGVVCVQRAQWGWLAALAVMVCVTVFVGPLSTITNTGVALYFITPLVAAVAAAAYTFRMRDWPGLQAR